MFCQVKVYISRTVNYSLVFAILKFVCVCFLGCLSADVKQCNYFKTHIIDCDDTYTRFA